MDVVLCREPVLRCADPVEVRGRERPGPVDHLVGEPREIGGVDGGREKEHSEEDGCDGGEPPGQRGEHRVGASGGTAGDGGSTSLRGPANGQWGLDRPVSRPRSRRRSSPRRSRWTLSQWAIQMSAGPIVAYSQYGAGIEPCVR